MNKLTTIELLRMARPGFFVIGALTYSLGVGIARYLGVLIDWNIALIGQIWLWSFQIGVFLLAAFFQDRERYQNPRDGENNKLMDVRLWVAGFMLTATTVFTMVLLRLDNMSPSTLLLMVGILILGFMYAVPPFMVASTGYSEFVVTVIVACLYPIIGYLFQSGDLSRLVPMVVFPLFALHLAMMIVRRFSSYAQDMKINPSSLLVRMGWRNGMQLHNYLILGGYLLLGVGTIMGLPLSVTWPGFISLPLGIFQIWYLTRIEEGASPNWRLLTLNSFAIFALTAYILSFSFWTN